MGINSGQMAGNYPDTAAFENLKISVDNLLTLKNGTRYWTSLVAGSGAITLADGVFANLIPSGGGGGGSLNRTPISGTVTISDDTAYFVTENSDITMPTVTGFTGGESFSVSAAISATASTLAVEGTQSEKIAPSTGATPETAFNLTSIGVSFEFTFNAVTGNWEV